MVFHETKSKIVCTIGPASKPKAVLEKMVEAGMDVARLNMSHEDRRSAGKTFDTIRSVDDTLPILFDLQGPKIRIGEVKGRVDLITGNELVLSTEKFVGDASRVSVSHEELPQDVKVGNIIALNDGIIRLRVKAIQKTDVVTEVLHGGPISSRKGVNIPGIKLSCAVPTEEDLRDLDVAAELEPDLVALSFVTECDDVRKLREVITANGPADAWIISKIEHTLAIKNFDEILKESDGVMIARGDLGIEVPIEDVPILQKDLIRRANIWAKPAIVATHMLESMTEEMIPTRAEVSDVAHAIMERADAVMLSGETAVGHDPVRVVEMMERIVRRTEKIITREDPLDITSPRKMIVEIIGNMTYNAVSLIPDKIDGIITATRSGYTARWISKFRPPTSIFAVTQDERVSRRLRLLWGVCPITHKQDLDSVDDIVRESTQVAYDMGLISKEKDIVFTSGVKMIPGRTNVVGVFHVRDLIK
ncbi:MAG: pyruvate kinase [Candidatus Thorarchaeota archaeon]|nr:pyruvate kinase [Candidatus Thorarchaeota archaeon]